MIKILHIRNSNFYGGPEKQILEHLKILDSEQFDKTVMSVGPYDDNNKFINNLRAEGINCKLIKSKTAYDLRLILKLRRYIVQEKINLILTHGYHPAVVAYLANIYLNVPIITFSR